MPDKDALTPRVFLIRHGQTAWSLSGQFTSTTDLSLTAYGLAQVRSTARILYGPGRVLSPARIAAVLVSPRKRAQETAGAIFGGAGEGKWETAPELAEWEYGDYEGLLTGEIRALRRERGLDGGEGREWDIWRDGCEGGESPPAVATRLDALIARIRALQRPAMQGQRAADVVLVAHGHVLRAFAKRWLGYAMAFPLAMMLEPGGVGVLSYQHGNIDEPAFLLGMGFPVEGAEGKVEGG